MRPDKAQKSFGTEREMPLLPIAVLTMVAIVVNCAAVIPVAHPISTPSNLYLDAKDRQRGAICSHKQHIRLAQARERVC